MGCDSKEEVGCPIRFGKSERRPFTQGAFGKFPHGKRDGFPTMNILTLDQFPPFEGDSYIFPTHKRGLCQEGML